MNVKNTSKICILNENNAYLLDQTVQTQLQSFCSKKSNQKMYPSLCGCFLPSSTYSSYAKEKGYSQIEGFDNSKGQATPAQCWYPDCYTSSLPKYKVYTCPSTIICNTTVLNNIEAGGSISNLKILNEQRVNCGLKPVSSLSGIKTYSGRVKKFFLHKIKSKKHFIPSKFTIHNN